jgi:hypothetical protein
VDTGERVLVLLGGDQKQFRDQKGVGCLFRWLPGYEKQQDRNRLDPAGLAAEWIRSFLEAVVKKPMLGGLGEWAKRS